MNKYNDKLIDDYINGNDIDEYSLDELENDFDFMIEVIKKTHDKNIYYLCSEELKKDYRLIKYMIINFCNNIDFIVKLADDFLKNNKEDYYKMEIVVLICEYTKNNNEGHYQRFKTYREILYLEKLIELEILKEEFKNEEYILSKLGKGFLYIQEYYGYNNITLNYFAKRFIIDILTTNNMDLDELIHNQFNSYKELEDFGIKKYLAKLISQYDINLSNYILVHPKTLTSFIIEIKKIENNWYNYLEKQEKERYENMFLEVEEYINKNMFYSILSRDIILYYLGEKLGIEDKIKQYLDMNDEEYQALIECSKILINGSIFNITDIKHLINIKQIIINKLKLEFNKTEKQKQNHKILKLIYK